MGDGLLTESGCGDKGVEVGSTLDRDEYSRVGGDGHTNSGEAGVEASAAAASANCARGDNNKGTGGAGTWANWMGDREPMRGNEKP